MKIYMRNLTIYTVFQNEKKLKVITMLKDYTKKIYGGVESLCYSLDKRLGGFQCP
jgi:hypothetical protein